MEKESQKVDQVLRYRLVLESLLENVPDTAVADAGGKVSVKLDGERLGRARELLAEDSKNEWRERANELLRVMASMRIMCQDAARILIPQVTHPDAPAPYRMALTPMCGMFQCLTGLLDTALGQDWARGSVAVLQGEAMTEKIKRDVAKFFEREDRFEEGGGK